MTARNSGKARRWPARGRDRTTGQTGHASGARKYSVRMIRVGAPYGHLLNAARKLATVIKLFSTRCCRAGDANDGRIASRDVAL